MAGETGLQAKPPTGLVLGWEELRAQARLASQKAPGWSQRRGRESTPGRVRACAKALRLETDIGRVQTQPGPALLWVLRSPQDGNRGCPACGADMPVGGQKMHRIQGMKEGVGRFLRPLSHIATHGMA